MENKRLGRGLEHISDIFLSTEKETRCPLEKTRTDPSEMEAGVQSTAPSGPEAETDPLDAGEDSNTDWLTDLCEVEEKIMIEKNIAYPPAPDTQKKIIKMLCRHLEADYSIKRIELVRNNKNSRPGKNKVTEEKICIYLEEPPPIMEF